MDQVIGGHGLRTSLVLSVVLCVGIINAQTPTLPIVTNFSPKEYSAHAQNLDAAQDNRGVMYFANIQGVLEFDGKTWKTIPVGTNRMAYSLDIDSTGRVYVGGNGEFGYLSANEIGSLVYVSLADKLPQKLRDFTVVWNTYVLNGYTYFNTLKHIFVYNGDQLAYVDPKDEFHLSFPVGDQLWALEKTTGIYSIVGKQVEQVSSSEFFIDKSIFAILPYEGDKVLITTRENGTFLFSPKTGPEPFAEEVSSALAEQLVYGGMYMNNGYYAFNTLLGGVLVVSPGGEVVQRFARSEGLQNETVLKLFQDRNGQLWCGLDNGISLIAMNSPLTIAQEGKGFGGAIQAVTNVRDQLYVATTQGVFRVRYSVYGVGTGAVEDKDEFEPIEGIVGQCWDLLQSEEDVLVASANVFAIQDNEVNVIAELQARTLFQVKRYAHNVVLAGGREGLIVLQKKGEQWEETLRITDLPDEIIAISQEFDTEISGEGAFCFWLGTWTKGVIRLTFDEEFSTYKTKAYDQEDGIAGDEVITFNLEDETYFTANRAVYRYNKREGNFYRDTLELGKIANDHGIQMSSIHISQEGDVWINGGKNIYVINNLGKSDFTLDSLTFLNIDLGQIVALHPDRKGICWLGGDDGLAKLNVNINKDYKESFQCLIRNVVSGEDSLVFGGNYYDGERPTSAQTEQFKHVFPYSNNSITFEFSSTFFEYINQMEFSHMLEGYDQDFTSWKQDNKAVFTNLPEGDYLFRVKARNVYNTESTEATYEFKILPPWYRTNWAYILYVLGSVIIFVIGFRIYSVRLRRERDRLERLVQARTLELDEKNKDLEVKNEQITAQKALVEEQNKDITDSIVYAEKIQRALLTSEKAMKRMLEDHFVFYRPKQILSGDFYWAYFDQESNKVIYACVDCTGHGVPGALMSMIGHSFLNEIIIENRVIEPDLVLNQLRDQVVGSLGQEGSKVQSQDGMDMALCVWDKKNNKLEFSGANNPVYLVRDQELIELKPDRQPVGYFNTLEPFTVQEVQLEKNDALYSFSDGYADQFGGPESKKFMYRQFKELLVSVSDKPMEEQLTLLSNCHEEWKGDMDQIDDICVIGVRV